jgi:hypothetical protein
MCAYEKWLEGFGLLTATNRINRKKKLDGEHSWSFITESEEKGVCVCVAVVLLVQSVISACSVVVFRSITATIVHHNTRRTTRYSFHSP